jgi:hypothetical protein
MGSMIVWFFFFFFYKDEQIRKKKRNNNANDGRETPFSLLKFKFWFGQQVIYQPIGNIKNSCLVKRKPFWNKGFSYPVFWKTKTCQLKYSDHTSWQMSGWWWSQGLKSIKHTFEPVNLFSDKHVTQPLLHT